VRVLGVDPGSRKAGWGVVDVELERRTLTHVDNGVILLDHKAELPDRVLELSRAIHKVVETYRPTHSAVEDVFVQKGARSALVLGQARGAVLATLGLCEVPVASHTTSQVKSRVTGKGRATKLQVAEMVTLLLQLPEHPYEDAADALAVAICHALEGGVPQAPKPVKRRGKKRDALADLARAQGKL
jgi:crossover junction endodeoxyribonuclease RuvC